MDERNPENDALLDCFANFLLNICHQVLKLFFTFRYSGMLSRYILLFIKTRYQKDDWGPGWTKPNMTWRNLNIFFAVESNQYNTNGIFSTHLELVSSSVLLSTVHIFSTIKGTVSVTAVQFILFNFANYSPWMAMELKVGKKITCKWQNQRSETNMSPEHYVWSCKQQGSTLKNC